MITIAIVAIIVVAVIVATATITAVVVTAEVAHSIEIEATAMVVVDLVHAQAIDPIATNLVLVHQHVDLTPDRIEVALVYHENHAVFAVTAPHI